MDRREVTVSCRRVQEWLPAYVDGALPPRRARRVAAHLGGCPACRGAEGRAAAALAAFDAAGDGLLPTLDVGAAFGRVEERLDAASGGLAGVQPRPAPARPRWLDWRVLVPAGAALAAAAAVTALTLSGPPAGAPPDGGAPDATPVELAVARDLDLLEDLALLTLLADVAGDADALAALAGAEGLDDLEVVMALDELLAEEATDEG
jgi:anti-sigma factor RsiW